MAARRTRLELVALEDRTVPAGFSFTLGGDEGSGTFTTPAGQVDPSAASQSLPVPDLEVTLNWETFSGSELAATPTAEYAYGVLQGVTFAVDELPSGFRFTALAAGGGTVTGVEPSDDWVNEDGVFTYDPLTGVGGFEFDLPDHSGSVSFALDTGDVDPNDPSQYVFLTSASLTLAGQTVTAFDHAEAVFAYGVFDSAYLGWYPNPGGPPSPYAYAYADVAGSSVAVQLNDIYQPALTLTPDPVVTVAKVSDAAEGGSDGVFRFTRTGDTGDALTVNISVGGSATSGTDFIAIGTAVTFPAGKSTVDVAVAATYDGVTHDPDETVEVTVATGTGYAAGALYYATVTIADTAPPPALLVTTELDVVDATDNLTSLREAIFLVNQTGNILVQQEVRFAAGLLGKTVSLESQLPVVDKNIYINGADRDITIRRDETKGNFRLFEVKKAGTLEIAELRLENGYAANQLAGGLGGGGAIWSRGDLIATNCTFTGNSVAETVEFGTGGAIWASGQTDENGTVTGQLEISGCTFSCNSAPYGGAVAANDFVRFVRVEDSEFMQNSAGVTGGALYVAGQSDTEQADTTVTVTGCLIDDNTATKRGGGIYAENLHLILEGGTDISNNSAGKGGGVCVTGYTANSVLHGLISYAGVYIGGNTASDSGTGVYRDGAGRLGADGPGVVEWYGNPVNSETEVNPPPP